MSIDFPCESAKSAHDRAKARNFLSFLFTNEICCHKNTSAKRVSGAREGVCVDKNKIDVKQRRVVEGLLNTMTGSFVVFLCQMSA
jgi:hypothetical protein